jgi:shikimate 5-dehydrogenase
MAPGPGSRAPFRTVGRRGRELEMDELKGQVAMVVGASGGLGRGIAEGLHDAGASVIVVARSAAALDQLAKGYFVSGAHR